MSSSKQILGNKGVHLLCDLSALPLLLVLRVDGLLLLLHESGLPTPILQHTHNVP